jgi:PIN domain nuclease of toxin-antitoxin system
MSPLLDTQALLWFAHDDPQLSAPARAVIMDPANIMRVSPASYWETALKISVNKYSLALLFEDFMRLAIEGNGFQYLHIEPRHVSRLITLPYHHRDPFDRLLVAQALVENVTLISNDTVLDQYGITRIW